MTTCLARTLIGSPRLLSDAWLAWPASYASSIVDGELSKAQTTAGCLPLLFLNLSLSNAGQIGILLLETSIETELIPMSYSAKWNAAEWTWSKGRHGPRTAESEVLLGRPSSCRMHLLLSVPRRMRLTGEWSVEIAEMGRKRWQQVGCLLLLLLLLLLSEDFHGRRGNQEWLGTMAHCSNELDERSELWLLLRSNEEVVGKVVLFIPILHESASKRTLHLTRRISIVPLLRLGRPGAYLLLARSRW
jgi:hypothetical protein